MKSFRLVSVFMYPSLQGIDLEPELRQMQSTKMINVPISEIDESSKVFIAIPCVICLT
jgi:hypothetical protein